MRQISQGLVDAGSFNLSNANVPQFYKLNDWRRHAAKCNEYSRCRGHSIVTSATHVVQEVFSRPVQRHDLYCACKSFSCMHRSGVSRTQEIELQVSINKELQTSSSTRLLELRVIQ